MSIDAATLTSVIKDAMTRLNLPIAKLRGQCYDGCSTMSGLKTGVDKRISDEDPRAVFTHCYGHSLNLAASDTIKKSGMLRNALDTSHEITKLIKFSPRRNAIFNQFKAEDDATSGDKNAGIRVLCPTRWTVRADSLRSIIDNYSALMNTWDEAISVVKDTESRARIYGVQSQMKTFAFFLGTMFGELILRHIDNLSRSLQAKTICAAEGQETAAMVVCTLQTLRSDASFDMFWQKVTKSAEECEIDEPQVPRQHKLRKQNDKGFGEGDDDGESDMKVYFWQQYFEAFDLAINTIQDGFEQRGYKIYSNLEQLLLKACQKENFDQELEDACSFYKDDFEIETLRAQLVTFGIDFQRKLNSEDDIKIKPTWVDIMEYFQSLQASQKALLSQVCNVLKILLVMPATNVTSERSFSALHRVKKLLAQHHASTTAEPPHDIACSQSCNRYAQIK